MPGRKTAAEQTDEKAGQALKASEPRSVEPRGIKRALDAAWSDEDGALADRRPVNDAGVSAPGPLFPWMPSIPLFFLGLGLYRAWIEVVFVTPILAFPSQNIATHDVYDCVMVAVLLLCAVFSRAIGPLFGKRSAYALTVAFMLAGSVSSFLSMGFPALAVPLGWIAAIAGGTGTALVILLWSELYGCLNPFRVALYYSASLVVAAVMVYLCRSVDPAGFAVLAIVLPLFSLGMVAAGFRSLSADHLPRSVAEPVAIPWKIILIMGVYAFAYGLKETQLYQSTFGPHSSFGVVTVAALMFLLVVVRGKRFEFSIIFRVALPLAVCAFLVLPSVGNWGTVITNFCIGASYTAFSIFTMIVMANFCYRYGASAILFFGIERGLRALFMLAGRHADAWLHRSFDTQTGDAVLSALVIVMVVVATMMLLSDKDLAGRWGLAMPGMHHSVQDAAQAERDRLLERCQTAAQRFGLSRREEEVLCLLAQQKKIGAIEQELFISNNTAKTHIRHVYRKLDVHSRDELAELLDSLDDETKE